VDGDLGFAPESTQSTQSAGAETETDAGSADEPADSTKTEAGEGESEETGSDIIVA
jgi:hypothetical protein